MSLSLRLLCAAILVGALFRYALPFLLSLAFREPPVDNGERILVYSKRMRGFVVALGMVVVAMLTFILAVKEDDHTWGWLALIGLFVTLLLPMALEVFFVSIVWDDVNIYTRSPWRRSRAVPLSTVQSYDYSAKLRWYRIHTRGHGIVRLPSELAPLPWDSGLSRRSRGIPELLAALPRPSR